MEAAGVLQGQEGIGRDEHRIVLHPALVDGLEGRRSLELITALYESIETNTDVQLRFRPKKCRLGLAS